MPGWLWLPQMCFHWPSRPKIWKKKILDSVLFFSFVFFFFFPTSLRSKFPHGDMSTNPGYVLSPVITQRDGGGDNSCSVKVSIEISESEQPVTFTCDGKHNTRTHWAQISMSEYLPVHDGSSQSVYIWVCSLHPLYFRDIEYLFLVFTGHLYPRIAWCCKSSLQMIRHHF